MALNILQFFENLLGVGKTPNMPATPSTLQSAINTAGKALDDAEAIVSSLQGLSGVLPAPFQGYLAALAVAVHSLDSYVDTLETPAVPGTPVVTAPVASVQEPVQEPPPAKTE